MRAGPSVSAYRSRYQTASEPLGLSVLVVSVRGKGILKVSGKYKEDECK
jgi:hypothetical protein